MRRADFTFDLPPHLIAQQPAQTRSGSRLLCLDRRSGTRQDRLFTDFPALLRRGDVLVFNDTRVIPARLLGHKASGGKVEVLIERILDDHHALAQVRASKSPKPGSCLHFSSASQTGDFAPFDKLRERNAQTGELDVLVQGRQEEFFVLEFLDSRPLLELLHEYGHIPLPPYIQRPDAAQDQERYQTVYARQPGAVAAPTAGLHFDPAILQRIQAAGVDTAFVTLHVGAGTFQPVRVDELVQHRMHAEYGEVSPQACAQIMAARQRGGRVVAVGTTSVRALESASQSGQLTAWRGETRLFITPGYVFHSVDALLTNFHLPESTLLMLVSAFAGYDATLAAYRHAVEREYRFFSYGDAMFMS